MGTGLQREAAHSYPSSAEVKNDWSYTSTPYVPSRRGQWQLHVFKTNLYNGHKTRSTPPPPHGRATSFSITQLTARFNVFVNRLACLPIQRSL
jgi:hypothetical protein